MKIYEYRIVVPTTVDEYSVANLFMIMEKSREESGQGEGVEMIENRPYTRDTESGHFSYKILHFKSGLPGFVRRVIPDKYLHCHERSWNSYPHYHTEYEVPGMGDNFLMVVDSQHITFDPSAEFPDNLTGLSDEQLAQRKVVWLDLVDSEPRSEKNSLRGFSCPEGGVQPLSKCGPPDEGAPPRWTASYAGPMMCCVKVVTFRFKWFMLQTIVEDYTMNTLTHGLFLDAHRDLVRWSGQWFGMTVEDVRTLEREVIEQINALGFEQGEKGDSNGTKG